MRTTILVASLLTVFLITTITGCAQLARYLQPQPTADVIAIDPGPDGEVGTSDDVFITGPGPDGELGTMDDTTTPGKSKLQMIVGGATPIANAAGFGPWALLAQGAATLLTQGYALVATTRRREDEEDAEAA